jgi:CBS domain-containing protein
MTALVMPRSILTEKLSRRGYHLTREYGVDPLEIVTLSEVMREVSPHECEDEQMLLPEVYTYADETSRAAVEKMATSGLTSLLVVDRGTHKVCGRVGLQDLQRERQRKRVFELLKRRADKAASNIRA